VNKENKKSILILSMGSYLTMGVDLIQNLILVPIYINYFGTELYGLWIATGGIVSTFAFLDLGIASLSIQKISKNKSLNQLTKIGDNISTSLILITILATTIFSVGSYFSVQLLNIIPYDYDYHNILLLCFVISLLGLSAQLIGNVIEGILISLKKELYSKKAQVFSAVVGVIVLTYLTFKTKSITAIPIGLASRSILNLIINLTGLIKTIYIEKIYNLTPRRETVKEYLIIIPYLFLSKFFNALSGSIESIAITKFISPEVTTFYTVSKKLASFIRSIIDKIGGIIYPQIPRLDLNKLSAKKTVTKLFKFTQMIAFVFMSVYVISNEIFVNIWVSPEHYIGEKTSFLIACTLLIGFFTNYYNYCLGAINEFKFSSTISFIEAFLKSVFIYTILSYKMIDNMLIFSITVSFIFMIINLSRWRNKIHLNEIYKSFFVSIVLFLFVFTVKSYLFKDFKIDNNWLNFIILSFISFSIFSISYLMINKDLYSILKKNIFK